MTVTIVTTVMIMTDIPRRLSRGLRLFLSNFLWSRSSSPSSRSSHSLGPIFGMYVYSPQYDFTPGAGQFGFRGTASRASRGASYGPWFLRGYNFERTRTPGAL